MQSDAKRLFELATVDLLYASLEVKCAEQPSEAMLRIGDHLEELMRHLAGLERIFEGADAAANQRFRA